MIYLIYNEIKLYNKILLINDTYENVIKCSKYQSLEFFNSFPGESYYYLLFLLLGLNRDFTKPNFVLLKWRHFLINFLFI